MQSVLHTSSPTTRWVGRIMSAVPTLLLLFAGIMGVLRPAPAVEGTVALGYPASLTPIIGLIVLSCLALYLLPRTAVLGAILLTGYLGGAVATHVRMLDMASVPIPLIVGVLLWGGLYLRDPQLRLLIPLRQPSGG